MHALLLSSTLLCVLFGIYALAAGDWSKMHLKRAGVMLGTTASLGFAYIMFFYPQSASCKAPDIVCASFGIYCLFKNIAVLIFLRACGRDALEFKNKERQGIRLWTSAKSYSRRERWRA